MNPKTKLTVDQLKVICGRHKIPYVSHSRINSGFSHEVHRLNDDLVIKLYNTKKPKRFRTELAVLGSDLPFLKSKLIASYEARRDTDRSYIIMSFVAGTSLGSKWHEANDEQRKRLIKAITQILRAINRLPVSTVIPGKPEFFKVHSAYGMPYT
jgi:hypothetical protein